MPRALTGNWGKDSSFISKPLLSNAHFETFGNYLLVDPSKPLRYESRRIQASQNTASRNCAFCWIQGCVPSFAWRLAWSVFRTLYPAPKSSESTRKMLQGVGRLFCGHGEQVCGPGRKWPSSRVSLLQPAWWLDCCRPLNGVLIPGPHHSTCQGDWLTAGILILMLCWGQMVFFWCSQQL